MFSLEKVPYSCNTFCFVWKCKCKCVYECVYVCVYSYTYITSQLVLVFIFYFFCCFLILYYSFFNTIVHIFVVLLNLILFVVVVIMFYYLLTIWQWWSWQRVRIVFERRAETNNNRTEHIEKINMSSPYTTILWYLLTQDR